MSLENSRVFIGNVYYLLTTADLKQIFSAAGVIAKCELFIDDQGKSRGCGIIYYNTKEEALKSIEMFHHTELFGRIITVKEDETFYLQNHRPIKVVIKKMPMTVTWQQLKDVCRSIGSILRADVQIQNDGTSSGTALFEKRNIKSVE